MEVIRIFFTSKKDVTYFLAVWGTIAFVSLVIILNFSLNVLAIFSGLLGLIGIGLLIWVWFGTSYRIENESIQIKYGPFKWKVSIEDINSISKRKNLLITPALAMDRLLLRYGKYGEILLSPKNEVEFIDLLLAKNLRIKLDERISKT